MQQYKSQIKDSAKPRLARFRNFATEFFDEHGLDGAMSAIIGDVVLNEQLREEGERCRRDHEEKGWDEVRWRTRSALQGGEGTGGRKGRTGCTGTRWDGWWWWTERTPMRGGRPTRTASGGS